MIMQMSRAAGLPDAAALSHLGDFLETPQDWNRYSYVRNNPLNLIDPFGQQSRASGHHLIPGLKNLSDPLARSFVSPVFAWEADGDSSTTLGIGL